MRREFAARCIDTEFCNAWLRAAKGGALLPSEWFARGSCAIFKLFHRARELEMRMVRELDRGRILRRMSLFGMLLFSGGCDGSGGGGESNLTPTTPPPGQSAKELAKLQAMAFGPKGQLPKQTAPKK
jgi:hypothetical protein